jgi:mRNA-degrading endonuclease toxin of MazEF toxin-antitoxin module
MQGASRDFHGKRWVIVLQAAAAGADRALPTVAVVPCTASHEGRASVWDLELPDGEPGFTKPNIVALVSCLQPMLKTDLVEWMGQLRPETLGRMLGVHARNLGMTPGDLRRLL